MTSSAHARTLLAQNARNCKRKAVQEGIEHGRKIGNRAVNLFLQPVH
jgi:hypothetical protein